ncbi:MAG: hypothetical protein JSU58_09315 [Dehalococcoidales bacterium]|nr:MAG: hypothetical protein JSU58_09315 [Dehalococcoidales bacterium]
MIIQDNTEPDNNEFPPEVGACYSYGLKKLSKYFIEFLLIFIIMIVFGIPTYIVSWFQGWGEPINIAWAFFGYGYSFFITGPLEYGVSFAYLKAARGEKPEIKDLVKILENYWNIVIASILFGFIFGIGFILPIFVGIKFSLLIIPSIYLLCKLVFVRYLVVDEKMPALAAIRESWNMTNGHTLTIFLMGLLAIPIIIAGILLFGIGVIFSWMWIEAAFASLYHAASSRRKSPAIHTV